MFYNFKNHEFLNIIFNIHNNAISWTWEYSQGTLWDANDINWGYNCYYFSTSAPSYLHADPMWRYIKICLLNFIIYFSNNIHCKYFLYFLLKIIYSLKHLLCHLIFWFISDLTKWKHRWNARNSLMWIFEFPANAIVKHKIFNDALTQVL